MNPYDPFLVTTKEKLRFEQQFNALQPIEGYVTGGQAKGFFLKSGLSPLILGQIWALADTDADGRMNLIEFSIACKLISCKLRNVEVPKQLPPTLIASLQHIGTPIRTPTGAMSPTESYKQFLTQQPVAVIPIVPSQLIQQPQQIQPSSNVMGVNQGMTTSTSVIPQQQIIMPTNITPAVPLNIIPQQIIPTQQQQQHIAQVQAIPQQMMTTHIPSQPSIQNVASANTQTQSLLQQQQINAANATVPLQMAPIVHDTSKSAFAEQSLLDNLTQTQASVVSSSVPLPAAPTPTPPQSGHASRSMSFSEKAPSIPESPSMEWIIPQSSKLKYTQMFNQTDKLRQGFLTGTQARGILLETNVPQASLAKIWALSDRNSDGRLGCEEFVLALYLCEMFATGKPIPNELPPELIPPSFRKLSSRSGSLTGSRHGSVSSQGAAITNEIDAMTGMPHSSFEDKRKENYDKGQAELERRRRQLADIQKKEQDERERKERDDAEKKEKARIEAELKKQQEVEREIQRQKELEQEREEQRKRELEKKEQARKELEKQRQLEWESQKLQEMELERQKEQDRLLKLKGHNQTLTIELETLSTKVKELSQKICDTRVAVTNVKSTIDGMRSTRDTCVSEQTLYKSKIKEQNAKLVQLSQDKAKLDAKTKNVTSADEQAYVTNKQIHIKQLKDKIEDLNKEMKEKSNDFIAHKDQKTEIRSNLQELLTNCEQLYNEYDTARIQVLEIRNNRKNDSFTTSTWGNSNSAEAWRAEDSVETTKPSLPTSFIAGYTRYKAVYEFYARNSDEITFQPGDIIMVPNDQNPEPGWLAGQINGHTGWFPESYAEKCEDGIDPVITGEAEVADKNIEETNGEIGKIDGEKFIACYPYQSAEVGDLNFEVGEEIMVIKKEGDWWTGVIGNRSGMFPANYVQSHDDNTSTNTITNDFNGMKINGSSQDQQETVMSAEEAANQVDVDSEVSQINTHNVANDVSMQEFRGMTSSASLRGKKGEVAQVIAPYEATSSEQLSLQKGQLIMIRKKTESGWWQGELQSKGRNRKLGWFPATYVKVLAGGKMSGRSTPLSSSKINLHETVIDKVQAMYPYSALNDDELSFEPDDIISVLSRDEPDWWRGELNGITGLFPSNYVRTFVSSGNM